MTEAHIKEATKLLSWFFDRCGNDVREKRR